MVDQYICNSLFYNIGANYLLTGSGIYVDGRSDE